MKKSVSFRTYMFTFIFISIAIVLIFSSCLIKNAVDKNIETILEQELLRNSKIVESIYSLNQEHLFKAGYALSNNPFVINAVEQRDLDSLGILLTNLKESEDADIALFIDQDQNILLSANNMNNKGKSMLLNLVNYSFENNIPILSTEIIPSEELFKDDEEFILLTKTRRIPSIYQKENTGEVYEINGLGQVVILPITKNNNLLGGIMIINLLNRDYSIPQQISTSLGLSSSIYQNDVTISTSVLTQRRNPQIGTVFPEPAFNKVFVEDETFFGRVWTKQNWFRAVYIPLHNYESEIVGALAINMPEKDFREVNFLSQNFDINQVIFISTLIALLMSVFFAVAMSDLFIKPITELIESMDKAGKGNLKQGMKVKWFSEMNDLVKHYNILIRNMRHKLKKLENNKKKK